MPAIAELTSPIVKAFTSNITLLNYRIIRTALVKYCSQSTTKMTKPVEESILKKLTEALNPTHLEIVNESYMHNVPKGSETHFKVLIVSSSFNQQPLIKRHQTVHEILKEELIKGPVHALSIMAKTPEQWEKSVSDGQSGITKSPPCLGGFGK